MTTNPTTSAPCTDDAFHEGIAWAAQEAHHHELMRLDTRAEAATVLAIEFDLSTGPSIVDWLSNFGADRSPSTSRMTSAGISKPERSLCSML